MLIVQPLPKHCRGVVHLDELRWEWVDSEAKLASCLGALAHADAVAVDTEFVRERTYYPKVALLQLSDGENTYLIDALTLANTEPLIKFFANANQCKVIHSGSEDIEVLQRWLGGPIRGWFDTQVAAALCDIGFGLGFRTLVHSIVGIELDKGETRSNWLQRPLTNEQCAYAAADVVYLMPVYRHILAQLNTQDRIEWVLEEGERAVEQQRNLRFDYRQKIGSAWKLSRRELGVLEGLCQARDEIAQATDTPRGWVIDDSTLVTMAQRLPSTKEDLAALLLGKNRSALRHSSIWLAQIQAGWELPEAALPEPLPPPLSSAARAQIKILKQAVLERCEALGVAPEIVFNKHDYSVWLELQSGASVVQPEHWSGWRGAFFVQPMLDASRA